MAEPSRLPTRGGWSSSLGQQTRRALLSLGGRELGQGLLREPCGPSAVCCWLGRGSSGSQAPPLRSVCTPGWRSGKVD